MNGIVMRKLSLVAAPVGLAFIVGLTSFSSSLPDAQAQQPAAGTTKPAAKPGAKPISDAGAAAPVDAAPPPPPGPKPLSETLTDDAKADYESGKLLFTDGDNAGALIKFQSAFDKSKDVRLLWNMAACEKNLRHYAKVLKLVRRYVAEGADKLTDADRQEANDLIKAIEPFTASLKIAVNEPGAEVFVDDESVGITPLDKPILVDIGSRRVRIVKAGYKEASQTVPVGGASEVPLDMKLVLEVHEGRIIVNAHAEDTIVIDGKPVGSGRWEGPVKSGGHTLRVTARGMRPYQSEVMVQDNETRSVDVGLDPEAKPASSNTWLWIAGGVALAAGAGVGGYFLFRPKDETTPPVAGTMDTGQSPPGTVRLPLMR